MKNFNPEKFLQEYGINYFTSGKNVSVGWLGINCPFCNDPSNHGGWHIQQGNYSCWICGPHPSFEVIKALLHCSTNQAWEIINQYSSKSKSPLKKKPKSKSEVTECKFPYGTIDLLNQHRIYLQNRNFEPDKLIKEWGIKATGHLGDYRFRIIVPIYYEGRMVSYQGRAINKGIEPRYKTCRQNEEVIHHKEILYGLDKVKGDSLVVVEGITDVWRLGAGAVATFGTKYTDAQVALLSQYRRIGILFDAGANKEAAALSSELLMMDCRAELLYLKEGDPAELSNAEARKIMLKFFS